MFKASQSTNMARISQPSNNCRAVHYTETVVAAFTINHMRIKQHNQGMSLDVYCLFQQGRLHLQNSTWAIKLHQNFMPISKVTTMDI